MSDSLSRRNGSKGGLINLSAQAHKQAMDYLRVAETSKNPAIVKAAVALAQEKVRHQQSAESKISPALAAILATCMVIVACLACWYALVKYPGEIGLELVSVITILLVLAIGIYVLLSGHLSQTNFMKIFKWVGDGLKHLNPAGRRKGISVSANDDSEPPSL
jgi:hypothetical protein